MRRISFIAACVFFALCCGGTIRAQENGAVKLTLRQAVELAVKNNPAMTQAEAAVAASAARVKQRESAYYPSVDIGATCAHLDPDPAVPFPGFGTIQFFPENNYDAHVGLRYDLFDFGRTASGRSAAKAGLSAARNSAGLMKENLAFHAIQTYYTIALLQQSIQVQEQQLKFLSEHLVFAQKKQESGSATGFDVLTTKLKLAEAQNKMSDLHGSLDKQLIHFRQFTGLKADTPLLFDTDLTATSEQFTENDLVEKALHQRLELANAHEAVVNAHAVVSSAASEHLPTVGVSFAYGIKNGYMPELAELKNNTVTAARLEVPIFNGFRTTNQVREARANLQAAQARERDTADTIAADVRQALSDVRSNADKIAAAELQVKLAGDALDQAKVRYASGIITNLDLLNVETSLDQAQLQRLQSQYNCIISREALKKASGDDFFTFK